jgi:hypothetical protein
VDRSRGRRRNRDRPESDYDNENDNDNDNDIVHIGGADVTVDNGFHIHKLDTLSFVVPAKQDLYAVKDNDGDNVECWILIPDGD